MLASAPPTRRAPLSRALRGAMYVGVLAASLGSQGQAGAPGPLGRLGPPAAWAQEVPAPPTTPTPPPFAVEVRPTPRGEPFGPALPDPAAPRSPTPTPTPPGRQAARIVALAVVAVLAVRALRLREGDRR